MGDLTIFSIATDRYLDFWIDLASSANLYLDKEIKLQWILFTNRESAIPENIRLELGSNLIIKNMESMPWPMPTLMRYQLLSEVMEDISGDIVMYLDADMVMREKISMSDLTYALNKEEVALIQHPGYYRPSGFSRCLFYYKNPYYIIRDSLINLRFGSLGTWELNRNSKAFVSRFKRKKYVCGGTWFGKRESIIAMSKLLSARINLDLKTGYIAKFHDESHLNWYASQFKCSISAPIYCFDENYPQLKGLNPKIIAINKGMGKTWSRD